MTVYNQRKIGNAVQTWSKFWQQMKNKLFKRILKTLFIQQNYSLKRVTQDAVVTRRADKPI